LKTVKTVVHEQLEAGLSW